MVILGALVAIGTGTWFALKGRVAVVMAVVILTPELAYTAFSGNVNAFVLVGTVGLWLADRSNKPMVSGGILAALVALKVLPILLLAWFVSQRRRQSLQWFAIAAAAIGFASVAGAGVQSHLEWLTMAGQQPSVGYPASLTGIAAGVGVPLDLLPAIIPATALLALYATWRFRSRPALTFAVLVAASVLCNPTTHAGSYALLLPALTPWTGRAIASRLPPVRTDGASDGA